MIGNPVMRMHNPLNDIIATKGRLAVLRVLVQFPRKEFTGRELARYSRVSLAQAQTALDRLRLAGIVERRSVGRSHQWRIIDDNLLWPPLRDLFRAERSTLGSLEDDVRTGLAAVSIRRARIFGSVAANRERVDSDIDLFLEIDDEVSVTRAEAALAALAPRIGRKYGVRLSPVIVRPSRRKNVNPNILTDVEEHGLQLLPAPNPNS